MATWRVKWGFRAANQTWTEQVYVVGVVDTPAPTKGIVDLTKRRYALLSLDTDPLPVVIDNVLDPNRTHRWNPVADGVGVPVDNPGGVVSDAGFLIRAFSASGDYSRSWLLRGGPSSWIFFAGELERGARIPAGAGFGKQLDDFCKAISGTPPAGDEVLQCAIRARDRTGTPPPEFRIVGIAKDATTERWRVQAVDSNFTEGERIVIAGVKGPGTKGILGTHIVRTVLGGFEYELQRRACDDCTPDPKRWGTARRLADYAYFTINAATPVYVSMRDTGLAVAPPRGRGRTSCCS